MDILILYIFNIVYVPIKGLIMIIHKPLNTIYIPNALGNFFKVQHSDMQRLRFTNVPPRKNPAITNMISNDVLADCSANTMSKFYIFLFIFRNIVLYSLIIKK